MLGIVRRVCGEHVIPHCLEVFTKMKQPLAVGAIVTARSFRTNVHQMCIFEDAEMLRYSRLGHVSQRRQLSDRVISPGQSFQQVTTSWIRQSDQGVFISHALYKHIGILGVNRKLVFLGRCLELPSVPADHE